MIYSGANQEAPMEPKHNFNLTLQTRGSIGAVKAGNFFWRLCKSHLFIGNKSIDSRLHRSRLNIP